MKITQRKITIFMRHFNQNVILNLSKYQTLLCGSELAEIVVHTFFIDYFIIILYIYIYYINCYDIGTPYFDQFGIACKLRNAFLPFIERILRWDSTGI